jgi:hypothetical protein
MDVQDALHGTHAPHNPSVAGSIPTRINAVHQSGSAQVVKSMGSTSRRKVRSSHQRVGHVAFRSLQQLHSSQLSFYLIDYFVRAHVDIDAHS